MRTQFVPHREQSSFPLENANQFGEIIVVCHDKYKEHINTLYQYAEFLNFQAGFTRIYH